ncbi:MAG: hypothetical protein RLZZ117_2782 [Cyanobacteriota bacterium]
MRLNRARLSPAFKASIVPAALIASLAFPCSASALSTGYQTAGSPVSFTRFGNGTTSFTPPVSFPGFNPAALPPSHLNPVLYGFRYFINNVMLGGSVGLATDPASSFTANPSVTLSLDSISPSGAPVQFSIAANTITGNATPSITPFPISNTATSAVSPDIALPPPLDNFTTPNTVSTDFFSTAWSLTSTPDLAALWGSATINGQFGLEYVYTYVPGPLPILGAGAAFGWTRRLRRRISKSA